jgi:hypothetical protein
MQLSIVLHDPAMFNKFFINREYEPNCNGNKIMRVFAVMPLFADSRLLWPVCLGQTDNAKNHTQMVCAKSRKKRCGFQGTNAFETASGARALRNSIYIHITVGGSPLAMLLSIIAVVALPMSESS